MKNWVKENKSNLIVFFLYLVITFSVLVFHENWRDEAQAWLVARELNFFELIAHMKYEGHFLLWYLILMPFAKLGFPYITMNIISVILTASSVWLILKYAPFHKYKKYLFIFSFPMIYLFPIVSRCYCLIPLAITLMAMFYQDRKNKPIRYILAIALLANTHVIMLGMVGVLLIEFYGEQIYHRKENTKKQNRKIIISFFLICGILMASMLPLLHCLTTNQDIGSSSKSILIKVANMLIVKPFEMIYQNYGVFKNEYIISLFIMMSIIFIFFIFFELKKYKKEFFEIVFIYLWQYMIYTFIYPSSYQRAATGILILVFYWWIRKDKPTKPIKETDKKIISMLLTILLIANVIEGGIYLFYEINYNYSSSYQTAKFINDNLEKDSIMVVGNQVEFCSAVIPYVSSEIKFYYVQEDRYCTYAIMNGANKIQLNENFVEQLSEKFQANQNLYYLYTPYKGLSSVTDVEVVNKMIENSIFEEIFTSDKDFFASEFYIIYKINLPQQANSEY